MEFFTIFSRMAVYLSVIRTDLSEKSDPHESAYANRRDRMNMSTEESFVQQFAKLFVHYRDALTLDTRDKNESELQRLNETPVVELDRLISAARLALLEIENSAHEQDEAGHYYANPGEPEWGLPRSRFVLAKKLKVSSADPR